MVGLSCCEIHVQMPSPKSLSNLAPKTDPDRLNPSPLGWILGGEGRRWGGRHGHSWEARIWIQKLAHKPVLILGERSIPVGVTRGRGGPKVLLDLTPDSLFHLLEIPRKIWEHHDLVSKEEMPEYRESSGWQNWCIIRALSCVPSSFPFLLFYLETVSHVAIQCDSGSLVVWRKQSS